MDLFKVMQQAQQVQTKLQEVQEELARVTVTGVAGGGLVRVDADGKGTIKRVRIDPSAVKADDVEGLEDLVTAATADAQRRATEYAQAEVKKLTGGLNLPFPMPF
ncbi:MAG: YbaB/EbfC family nucleoid-associated protein [Gemmatimonadetes bacterium]|nr:YbaB/EbfC family nucleoid-associated protein [Gemmatimonadota bacterium]